MVELLVLWSKCVTIFDYKDNICQNFEFGVFIIFMSIFLSKKIVKMLVLRPKLITILVFLVKFVEFLVE